LRLEARVLQALTHAVPARARDTSATTSLHRADGASLVPVARTPRPGGDAVPELLELPLADLVRGEHAATGMWFTAHPLDVLVSSDTLTDTVPAAALAAHVGRRVRVCGIPCAMRRVETASGGAMLFTTLADHSGLIECVLFPMPIAASVRTCATRSWSSRAASARRSAHSA
jgi:DNA polymerase III alpha subunit